VWEVLGIHMVHFLEVVQVSEIDLVISQRNRHQLLSVKGGGSYRNLDSLVEARTCGLENGAGILAHLVRLLGDGAFDKLTGCVCRNLA
jgi:hypothetical protein